MSRAREFADLAGSADAGGLTGRNLIINGAMQVAQRGTSVSSFSSEGYASLDRWKLIGANFGTWTVSQSTDVPSGQGFGFSMKLDCTSADTSIGASDSLRLRQGIEGQNVQNLAKGTSGAKSVTFSFWVKSNKTGTYGFEFRDQDNTRHNCRTYTIDSANTWEKKTLTFPGDTSGALDNDNAMSLQPQWFLIAGSNLTSGTAQTTWGSAVAANRAVGHNVNIADSTDNEWYICGVQMELGEQATPFEHRSFADELRRCQRYFQDYTTDRFRHQQGYAESGTAYARDVLIPQMRANPTVTVSDENRNGFDAISAAGNAPHRVDFTANCTVTGTSRFYDFKFTADAEL
tara:strand:+ start:139 stop:1176 length:1038 start_codon:yes stop_codon:yes gene_type:complete